MAVLRELLLPAEPGDLDGLTFETIEDLVDDDPPTWEGDDRVHDTDGVRLPVAGEGIPAEARRVPKRVVPFTRIIRLGKAGQDVTAVERALRRAHVRHGRPSGWMGPLAVRQVKAFQRKHGLPPSGVYGRLTHRRLLAYFDAYGAWLMQDYLNKHAAPAMRQRIVATGLFGVAHRPAIHYSQGPQRMDGVLAKLRPPRFPHYTDCSGFATWCYFVANAPDPSGFRYDASMPHWTGSLATHGHRVNVALPGDLILYGSGPPYEHVTIAIDRIRCVSHGSEPGPMILPIHYRSDFGEIRSYLPR